MHARRLTLVLLSSCFLLAAASGARSTVLWYNGDWNESFWAHAYENTAPSRSDVYVYDNFRVSSAGWTVSSVWSNIMVWDAYPAINMGYWEIRQGLDSQGLGTLVAGGVTSSATATPTGWSSAPFTEYTVEVSGLNVSLAAGDYWLCVAPALSYEGSLTTGVVATSHVNSYGDVIDDNTAYQYVGGTNRLLSQDFSIGVGGTLGISEVPEPSTFAVLVPLLLVTAGFLRRRRV